MYRQLLPILVLLAPFAARAAEESDDDSGTPATEAERPVLQASEVEPLTPKPVQRFFHGFRVGYAYVNGGGDKDSKLHSPHLFVIGYEATQRALGGGWLNVVFVENLSVSGLNQSLFIPTVNGLVGFEISQQIQVGTGVNVMPFDPEHGYVRMIVAAGYTPKAGAFNVPFHVTYIPDVEGHFRLGATVGVNW